jgi:hypothetical protein
LSQPSALHLGSLKVASVFDAAIPGQSQGRRQTGWHNSGSNRCKTLATDAAAVRQDGLATSSRVAAEKTVLPFAADFRRLILSFHNAVSKTEGDAQPAQLASAASR